jgi:GT2 family glycosyltransferase
MLYFIAAVYNEENEIADLVASVKYVVQGYRIVDDGSTDRTLEFLGGLWLDHRQELRTKLKIWFLMVLGF